MLRFFGKIALPVFILSLLELSAGHAAGTELIVKGLEEGIRQGDVVLVRVKSDIHLDSLSGQLGGRTFLFQGKGLDWHGLIGAAMDMEPGEYGLVLSALADARSINESHALEVKARDYRVERLSLPKKMVTPDQDVLARIKREAKALKRVKGLTSSERFWDGEFVRPAEGLLVENFGVRRILNGIEKKPHSGHDLKAYAGTPVKSPNAGRVIYVEKMYYGGKTVVIDHGHGLSTLYMHLSKILVNHGENVDKGEVIGLVGSTGRSTGPHLHWGAYLGGISVDPASLLSLSFAETGTPADLAEASTADDEAGHDATLGGN